MTTPLSPAQPSSPAPRLPFSQSSTLPIFQSSSLLPQLRGCERGRSVNSATSLVSARWINARACFSVSYAATDVGSGVRSWENKANERSKAQSTDSDRMSCIRRTDRCRRSAVAWVFTHSVSGNRPTGGRCPDAERPTGRGEAKHSGAGPVWPKRRALAAWDICAGSCAPRVALPVARPALPSRARS